MLNHHFPIVSHDVNVSFCSARWKTPCYVGIHTTVAQLVEPPSQVIPRISELVCRKIYWKLLYLWQNVWFLTDFSLNHFKPILWKKCFSGNIIITTPMLGRWNHGFLFPYHFCLQATVTVTGGYLISLILPRAGLYEEILSWRSSLGRWKKSGCQSQQPAVSWHDPRPGVPIVGVLLLETYYINETPMWCLVLSQV